MFILRSFLAVLAMLTAGLVLFSGTAVAQAGALVTESDFELAAVTINLDFNGARNAPRPRGPGPTFNGQGAAGGGNVWTGILVNSILPEGANEDNLTVGSTNMLNSLGGATTVSFTLSPVAGDGPNAGTDPTASAALFGDYLAVAAAGQTTGLADFTISGLGAVPFIDIYFQWAYGANFIMPGATLVPFAANGIYTPANTVHYAKLPVTNGVATGTVGTGPGNVTVVYGMTIQAPLPRPFIKSTAPTGGQVAIDAAISIELQDYVTQVVPSTVQLLVNGQAVAATVSKPAGSSTTTVTYAPAANWAPGLMNTVRILFSDNAATPVEQTSEFTFVALDAALAAVTYNMDFNGTRNSPGQLGPAVTYIGQGSAGGGSIWNGVKAESQQPDESNDDNLTVSTNNMLNSLGEASTVSFSIGPVACSGTSAGADPATSRALFGDYILVGIGNGGQITGIADFTISGLGDVPFVDLYFQFGGVGEVFIPGTSSTAFTANGIFTAGNTRYFAKVPVTNGTITGTMGTGNPLTTLYGMTIQKPLPRPYLKSASPTGGDVKANAAITVELQDYVTQVVPSSIQLLVNGQAVAATVSKPAGSSVTTVSYTPAGNWAPGSTNSFRIVFSDNAATPSVQRSDFVFAVLDEALAALTYNMDFNGTRNTPGQLGPAVTYIGPSAVGGGSLWNGVKSESQQPDGSNDDNLTVSTNNMLNSLGEASTVTFSIGPVACSGTSAGATPTDGRALFGDYVLVGIGHGGQITGIADFTIDGLGDVPFVDLYFYSGGSSEFFIPGASRTPFSATGIFASTTVYHGAGSGVSAFAKVAVTNGTITGTMGSGGPLTILYGMTIQKPLPRPYLKSASPTGGGVRANAAISIELADYVTQVVPSSVQLLVNGQAVAATVSKPAGSSITTVTYTPAGNWAQGSTNTFRLVFSDNAATPVVQTSDFTFAVLNEAVAAMTVNLDFNGARNNPVPRGPGPTFAGQGAAGGGSTWNGVLANSQLEDGTDDDNITVSMNNLVNSLGDTTTIGFTISPVAGDDLNAGSDPTAGAALFGDYILVGSGAQVTGKADFTISGLGTAPFVDLYLYYGGAANFIIPGASPTAFAAGGIFTPANTLYYSKVAVSNGTITGTMGNGPLTILYGLTIQKPLPQPFIKSFAPMGQAVRADAAITIEVQDYITQVAPSTIQVLINGQAVSPVVTKPAGATVTTVTYAPTGGFASQSANTVELVFSDTASPANVQSLEFSFVVERFLTVAPRLQDPGVDGLLVLEAEQFDGKVASGGATTIMWMPISVPTGFSGESAMQALPDGGTNVNIDISASPRLDYKVKFVKTGTMYVWVRGLGDSAPGPSASDSVNIGLDGLLPSTSSRISAFPQGAGYVWSTNRVDPTVDIGPARFEVSALGEHTLNVWMREDGFIIDKLVITTNPSYSPAGLGPAESPRQIETRPGPLSIARQGDAIILSWPGAATLQAADELTGQWDDIATSSPQTLAPTASHKFYRLRQ